MRATGYRLWTFTEPLISLVEGTPRLRNRTPPNANRNAKDVARRMSADHRSSALASVNL